ncbi:type I Zorya anti-phage system protein ZorC [Pseudomonas aeruginosa]
MSRALSSLSDAIARSLQRQQERTADTGLNGFVDLQRANEDLTRRFNQVEKALPPPQEKRREALRKFRRDKQLSSAPSEYRPVFAGLADKDDGGLPVLEDDFLFELVHREVSIRSDQQKLSRKDWLALCYSYFFYDHAKPADNSNWRVLRSDIDQGLDAVKRRIGREKEWMRIVQQHRELFGDQAGKQLAEEIFAGRAKDLSALQTIAQVPDSSWLWKRIFDVLLSCIDDLDDDTLVRRLSELIELGQLNKRYMDKVLSACLTRYYRSRFREQSSSLLKQAALEHWGSPQLRSDQNRWLNHVEQPVCAMVMAWFAKEDLEHFFRLLKGEAEVDHSRLFYWLRFANQMSYTRIVMGNDAWNDRGTDFVAFREKNKGRLSQLTGASRHVSAVVMQIGQFFFVEFSGTGHACYVYKADRAPFNPDRTKLDLTTELKQQGRELKRMSHSPAPRRPNLVEGWLEKFDTELRELGIVPQSPSGHNEHQKAGVQSSIETQLAAQLQHVNYQLMDNRSKGGALMVKLARDDARARVALARLGFKEMNKNPLTFWRS